MSSYLYPLCILYVCIREFIRSIIGAASRLLRASVPRKPSSSQSHNGNCRVADARCGVERRLIHVIVPLIRYTPRGAGVPATARVGNRRYSIYSFHLLPPCPRFSRNTPSRRLGRCVPRSQRSDRCSSMSCSQHNKEGDLVRSIAL